MRTLRRWLARVPLAAVAAGSFAGILSADLGWPTPWLTVLVVALVGAVLRRHWLLASGLAAWGIFWTLHGLRLDWQETAGAWVSGRGSEEAEVRVEATVLALRDRGGFLPRALVQVRKSEANEAALQRAVLAVRNLPGEVSPGDRLVLRGPISIPAAARNPGEFDRLGWMQARGIAAEMRAWTIEPAGPPAPQMTLHRVAWQGRAHLRDRIVAGLPEEGASTALIRGLVLGDRSGGEAEMFNAFRSSGTMHVFAVSGLHVGLVGVLGWVLMRLLRVPRAWGLWLVLVLLWSYAFITGLRPPALRASFMASVFLVGFAVKRQPSLANSLLASIPPVLLLDSFQLHQAGFQLSYVVVGMIILVAPLLYRRLEPIVEGDPFLPRSLYTRRQVWGRAMREKVLGLLAVSVAAWIGSVPLIAAHFGLVTPSAVLASMILIPLVFAILSIALLGVGVGLVAEPLEEGANRANGWLATGAYRIAQVCSEMPGSHFEVRRGGGWPDGILVFDLWSGDAAVYCGAGEGLLIDGGGDDEFRRVVGPAMREAGRSPKSLALTHPDGGHAGGLGPALERYGSRQLLLPVEKAPSPIFRALLVLAADRGCALQQGRAGKRYPLAEGVELEVIRAAEIDEGGRADNRGMVMRLHWEGWRILVTGDAGFEIEKELLERGADLGAEVWIMGRHQSDHTGTLEFVQAVGPKVIVADEDHYPPEVRIPEWWATAVEGEGIDLWRLGETGAVMMELSDRELRIRSFVDAARRVVLEK